MDMKSAFLNGVI
jgi:hypothetical protein